MALMNKTGQVVANISQPFRTFTTQVAYNTWAASLPLPADVEKFAVIKTWGLQPVLQVNGIEYTFETFRGFLKDFTPTTAYLQYELINYGGQIYRAIANFTSAAAFSPTNWDLISGYTAIILNFEPATPYSKYEVVYHNNDIYRAKASFLSTATFNSTDWEVVSKSLTTIPDFTPSKLYSQFEAIFVNGVVYRAKLEFTALAAFNKDDWQPISSAPEVFEYSAIATYDQGVIVIQSTNAFYTILPVPAGTLTSNVTYYRPIGSTIPELTTAAWVALATKPDLAVITDSIFDI